MAAYRKGMKSAEVGQVGARRGEGILEEVTLEVGVKGQTNQLKAWEAGRDR